MDDEDRASMDALTFLRKTFTDLTTSSRFSKEVKKDDRDACHDIYNKMENVARNLAHKNFFLAGRLAEAERTIMHMEKTRTYASQVKGPALNTPRGTPAGTPRNSNNNNTKKKGKPTIPPLQAPALGKSKKGPPPKNMSNKIVISAAPPQGEAEAASADDIKKILVQAIDPRATGLRVKLRNLGQDRIVVEGESSEDISRVKSAKLEEKGLIITEQELRKPQLIFYDVPADLTVDGIMNDLQSQNKQLFNDDETEIFKRSVNFKFKTGPKDKPEVHWVAEVTPEYRNRIRNKGKIYLQWNSCRVLDYINLSRCFKCFGLGHVAKFCKHKEQVCSHCTLEGHKREACPDKKKDALCALCKRKNKSHSHGTMDKECPSYKAALTQYQQTIDYGDNGAE